LALMLVALGYFVGPARKLSRPKPVLLIVLLGAAIGYAGVRGDRLHSDHIRELHRANSNFGLLQVVEWADEERRSFLNDYLIQNSYDPVGKKSTSMYTYLLHGLARGYTPRIEEALCIGLGVGIVPGEFAREGVRVDVVEINPAVVPLAAKYFDLKPETLHIHFGDGRYYIRRCQRRYDTIILDAFLGDSSPSHLLTREALAAVFKSVRIHQASNGNTFLVGSDQTPLRLRRLPNLETVHPTPRALVAQAFDGIQSVNPDDGIVLTDDYNPVEFYDARNRELLRRQLAFQMKGE